MFYKLYTNCIPVPGYNRSMIYDIQMGDYYIIPNFLCHLLIEKNYLFIEDLKIHERKIDERLILEQYFEFLLEKELIFEIENPEMFPFINLDWDSPSKINNLILDINDRLIGNDNLQLIINQIDKLKCKGLEIHCSEKKDFSFFRKLLSFADESIINSIKLYLKYDTNIKISDLKEMFSNYHRLSSIVIHSSPKNNIALPFNTKERPIIYIKQKMKSFKSCGVIGPHNFSLNLKLFTESLHHNTCLNRKLCIDENCEIKNCPAMERSFGNIKDTTLEEAINKLGFKDLWDIKKDDIDVCKDCEFRYMCTDCRAFIKDPNNIYSQPAKCTYNPYIALWKGQEGWISVKEWRSTNPDWEKDAVRMIPGKDYYK